MTVRAIVFALWAVAVASGATPPEAVREDFEGSRFPPDGWTTEGSGSGSWSWTNPGGYARGSVSVPPFGNVQTSLTSPAFPATENTRFRVQFRYKTDGFTEVRCYVGIGGWKNPVTYTMSHQWTPFDMYTTPLPAGVYKAAFEMSLSGGSHGMGSVWDIDDVAITRDNAAVAPTSLGRVKALYR